jgi:hypothetical protein
MSDIDVLNRILADEHFGIAAYDAALGSGLLDETTASAARAFRSDHIQHRDVVSTEITARGGQPLESLSADKYAQAFPPLATQADIVAYAIELEAGATRLYVATVPEFEDRSLALLGAEIGAVEAQHWAVLLAASGSNPVPSPIIEVKAITSMG